MSFRDRRQSVLSKLFDKARRMPIRAEESELSSKGRVAGVLCKGGVRMPAQFVRCDNLIRLQ